MPISTFFDGNTPTRLRGLLWLALSETGNVVTLTSTSDTGGGATQSWVAGTATIPCRIDPVTDRGYGRLTGGRVDERTTHVITVPAGTSLDARNRFAITGRGTFEITALHQQTSESARVFEVVEAS